MDNPIQPSKYKFPGNPRIQVGKKVLCNSWLKDGRFTDEDVESYIKENPGMIVHFDGKSQKLLREVLEAKEKVEEPNKRKPRKKKVDSEE